MAGTLQDGVKAEHQHDVVVRGTIGGDDERPGQSLARSVEAALGCRECGLRVLQLILTAPSWVHRRVESVSFRDNRTARRRVSVDFSVPVTAPAIEVNGQRYRLIPLTLMRRKTLVKFDLRDESDEAVPLLGLREHQALTQALVRGWAAAVLGREPDGEVSQVLHDIVSGTQEEMIQAYDAAQSRYAPADLQRLMDDDRFRAVIDRLTEEFALLVLAPERLGARRIYKFRYDEPLTFTYRRSPGSEPVPFLSKEQWSAALGWRPTRIRFPTPATEAARSYHFEVHAPEGVEIASATILAGRPSAPDRPSFDAVSGGFPTVDLHVADVPAGSVSRAQVDLQIAKDSWLLLAVVISWIAAGALWYAANRLGTSKGRDEAAASALFITFTAGAAAMLWRPGQHRMAVRLVSKVGALASATPVLLFVAAALFVYDGQKRLTWHLVVLAVVATIISVLISKTLLTVRKRVQLISVSPWEQGRLTCGMKRSELASYQTFTIAAANYGYDEPAIEVASAEAYSLEPAPTDDATAGAVGDLLDRLLQQLRCAQPSPAARPGPVGGRPRRGAVSRERRSPSG